MIIACPACNTRYVVPDDAIGVEGRTVRCAKCKHSWHQDGPEIAIPPGRETPAPTSASRPEPPREAKPTPEPATEAVAPQREAGPRPGPAASSPSAEVAEEPAPPPEPAEDREDAPVDEPFAEEPTVPDPPLPERVMPDAVPEEEDGPTVVETRAAPAIDRELDEDYSQFDYQPPFRGRRNPLKLWTAAAALFAVFALGTIGAISYWGMPDWAPFDQPTFALEQPDLVLDFPEDKQDRRSLPNNTEFFSASGTITNVGRETRDLPAILIVLRDARLRQVHSWVVAPPQATLAPGESVTINEAVTDVPRSAKYADIGWKPN